MASCIVSMSLFRVLYQWTGSAQTGLVTGLCIWAKIVNTM